MQRGPSHFPGVLVTDNVRFIARIVMAIMNAENLPILHISDEGALISGARFHPDVSSPAVWKSMLNCWASIYTSLPNRILTDQGRQFGELCIHTAQ